MTVHVSDDTDPELIGVPDSCAPVECDGDTSPPDVTATDNCGTVDPVEFSETRIDGSCPQEYRLVRSWSVTDACGNSDEATVTLNVFDDTNPVFSAPPADTQECDNFEIPAINYTDACDLPLGESTENDCTGSISSTTGEGCFEMLISCSACDDCGNCDTKTTTLTVEDTTPPQIFGVPDPATNECDDIDPQIDVVANDTCDSYVPVTKTFVRVPNLDCTETLTYTWTAKDDCGNTETADQEITIEDTTPPYFDSLPEDETLECETFFACNPPTASDICDQDVDVEWTPSQTNGSCVGEYTRRFTFEAEDDCGNKVTHTQIVEFIDTTPPYFISEPEENSVQYCNVSAPEVLTGADVCDPDPVESAVSTVLISTAPNNTIYHRTWCVADECGNDYCFTQTIRVMDNQDPVFDLDPADKNVECNNPVTYAEPNADDDCDGDLVVVTSEIRIDGSCEYQYTLIRTWYAVDSAGNSAQVDQTIEVSDTNAPYWGGESTADDTVECTLPAEPVVSANDACGDATLISTSATVPTSCPTEYSVHRSWTAVDECGNEDSQDQTIVVEDTTPPVLLIPGPYTAECGEVPICFPGSYNATDVCEGDVDVTYTESTVPTACPCDYTLVRAFEACDCAGNCDSESQYITVEDTTPPELHNVPGDLTIGHLNELPPLSGALNGIIVTDNSGMDIAPEVTQSGSSPLWVRTFCAEDCSGNGVCTSQDIHFIDLTPPNLPEVDDDTVECDEIPEPCDDNHMLAIGEPELTVVYSEVKEDISTGQTMYRLIRTWYVQDNSGNEAQEDQTITVVDTTPPLLTRYPVSVTVECDCDTMPVQPTLQAIDNCDPTVVVTPDTQTIANGSPFDYILVWTWVAEDSVGNSVSHTASVTVQDTTAPELALTPSDTAADCAAVPAAVDNYARDNCDENVNDAGYYDSVQTVIPSGNCPQEYSIVRHWETYDHSAASHYVSHTQTITVTDSTAPTFVSDGVAGCVNADDDGDFGVFDNIEDLFRASSTDDCSPNSQLSITVTGCNSTQISQSGAFSGSCFYQPSTHKLFVRASRDESNEDGRHYTLYADIADECGTKTVGTLTYWVPHENDTFKPADMTCLDPSVAHTYTG